MITAANNRFTSTTAVYTFNLFCGLYTSLPGTVIRREVRARGANGEALFARASQSLVPRQNTTGAADKNACSGGFAVLYARAHNNNVAEITTTNVIIRTQIHTHTHAVCTNVYT